MSLFQFVIMLGYAYLLNTHIIHTKCVIVVCAKKRFLSLPIDSAGMIDTLLKQLSFDNKKRPRYKHSREMKKKKKRKEN